MKKIIWFYLNTKQGLCVLAFIAIISAYSPQHWMAHPWQSLLLALGTGCAGFMLETWYNKKTPLLIPSLNNI
ncbi:MAG: hypothetical protein A3H57_04900 [Candidatus Taylorbacteria bacterium RIFCSPLOWO2_02_FULL_43_11]|uniref:Uncharacterized protein n=1 Tax=Candidatus Taylorbacteria bacterium RIFCSPHIGHO2_02_FULL_43_32b TaxID=1802306 RepID=A0A1G2MJV2_9BACT|nr:MAG: hypothetical protein A3C72_03770 [Candidatus Taylorbacteria bacterium RIFCSPHIGHO2_02_FULL_43_32b]OHA31066.1 MAG: hypothetical protein A3B08_01325 [Candidatus Taylorbacteria bacterium RIFCSPLOWO2_01_FULL_43_44]OHA37216.1 MAG: hypothetical protein A3H57_04900 [Candidatus Taylorbacteria bacterium RIFCSPLOWO2_02_FULL_43_11]